jgi:hypothetical protein
MDPSRVPYGEEKTTAPDGTGLEYVPSQRRFCPQCTADPGELHERGCPLEQCPICLQPVMTCGHNPWVVRKGKCYRCGEAVTYTIDAERTVRCPDCEAVIKRPDTAVEDWPTES